MDNRPETGSNQVEPFARGGVSRRAVVRTAAWSAPAVIVMTAAPANAAYSAGSVLSIGSITFGVADFPAAPPVYGYFSSNTNGGNNGTHSTRTIPPTQTDTQGNASLVNGLLTINVNNIVASGGGTDVVTVAIKVPGQNTGSTATPPVITNRGIAQYGSVSTGWTRSGNPSMNGTGNTSSKVTTFTFFTSAAVAGNAIPSLSFTVDVGSTNGNSVYSITSGKTIDVTATSPTSSTATLSAVN